MRIEGIKTRDGHTYAMKTRHRGIIGGRRETKQHIRIRNLGPIHAVRARLSAKCRWRFFIRCFLPNFQRYSSESYKISRKGVFCQFLFIFLSNIYTVNSYQFVGFLSLMNSHFNELQRRDEAHSYFAFHGAIKRIFFKFSRGHRICEVAKLQFLAGKYEN